MSRALSASRQIFAAAPYGGLPLPAQLAGLGTVLCLYRAGSGSLDGLRQATSVAACQGVDSEGVVESLCFHDAQQRCCWRLYLLPESDFLAWDHLVSQLPAAAEAAQPGVAERLWRRMATRLGGEGWRMCALRLHASRDGQSLTASPAVLSRLGGTVARRIARSEGAEGQVCVDGDPDLSSAPSAWSTAHH